MRLAFLALITLLSLLSPAFAGSDKPTINLLLRQEVYVPKNNGKADLVVFKAKPGKNYLVQLVGGYNYLYRHKIIDKTVDDILWSPLLNITSNGKVLETAHGYFQYSAGMFIDSDDDMKINISAGSTHLGGGKAILEIYDVSHLKTHVTVLDYMHEEADDGLHGFHFEINNIGKPSNETTKLIIYPDGDSPVTEADIKGGFNQQNNSGSNFSLYPTKHLDRRGTGRICLDPNDLPTFAAANAVLMQLRTCISFDIGPYVDCSTLYDTCSDN